MDVEIAVFDIALFFSHQATQPREELGLGAKSLLLLVQSIGSQAVQASPDLDDAEIVPTCQGLS